MNIYRNGIKDILNVTFHGLFGITWLMLLLGIVFVHIVSDKQVAVPFVLAAIVLVFHGYIVGGIKWIKRCFVCCTDKYSIVVIVIFIIAIQAVIQIYVGYEMAVTPAGDRGIIFKQASQMAVNGTFKMSREYNFYFLRYPNNMLLVILEAAWFMLLKAVRIRDFLYGNMALNIFAIDLAIILCTILVYRKYGKNTAVIFQLMTFLFIPFYTYIPFVYTDTLVLPLVAGILLCCQMLEEWQKEKGVKYYLILCAVGFLTWFGYGLKPTVAIISIAYFLYMLVTKDWKRGILNTLLIMSVFGACLLTFNIVVDKAEIVDQTNYDEENFPYEHWIMMGLKGRGNYCHKDRLYTSSFKTKSEKQKGDIKMIKERLKGYGMLGLLIHQYNKAVFTWSNGKYDMEFHLQRQPRRYSWLRSLFFKKGSLYPLYDKYCTIYHFVVLFLIMCSIVYGFLRHETDSAVMWKMALFGLFLFLSIWETKSRYVMQFVPVMLLVAVDMLVKLKKLLMDKIYLLKLNRKCWKLWV